MLQWFAARLVTWLPPVIAVLYVVLWTIGEAGRAGLAYKSVIVGILAIAIACAARLPYIALGILIGLPTLQLADVVPPPEANTWPVYGASVIVALAIGFAGSRVNWRLIIGTGFVTSSLVAANMFWSGDGGWASWTGGGRGNVISPWGWTIGEEWGNLLWLTTAWFVAFVLAWALGIAARGRLREQRVGTTLVATEERLSETDLELRLNLERARISRDVHDALAHSLAVIVSQAEGALATKRAAAARRSLETIASVDRQSLLDVRALVERIQDDDLTRPQPKIAELHEVVDALLASGFSASLRTLGEPRTLPEASEHTVFRIVQESFTNALKHSSGRQARVAATLDWRGPGLAIMVTSTGASDGTPTGVGVGIPGMKERARMAGGWLTAEPADDGAFVVTAFVPSTADVDA